MRYMLRNSTIVAGRHVKGLRKRGTREAENEQLVYLDVKASYVVSNGEATWLA
jgi:hypothetical protein